MNAFRASCLLAVALALSQHSRVHAGGVVSPAVQVQLEKAESGDPIAQFNVATAYDFGRGAPRDGELALHWYMRAASQGFAEAQNSVGSILQADKNFVEARSWYEKAAAQDNAPAANNLAYLYDLGLGVKQDRQRAFELYTRSANQGWPEAMWNLAVMYGAGQTGSPPDLFQACVWTHRAKRFAPAEERKLHARAESSAAYLGKHLEPGQLVNCATQARDWIPIHTQQSSDRIEHKEQP